MGSSTDGELPGDLAMLLAAGDYHGAARLHAEAGRLAEAEELLARVWDFAAAAELARRRGDRVATLRHLLDGKDVPGAAAVVEALRSGAPREELLAAAEVCQRRRLFGEAAALTERAGETALARELFVRANLPLSAARLDESMGRLREAGQLCEALLASMPPPPEDESARAHLVLGRVLGLLGRHEESARHLQRALASSALPEELSSEARRLLVVALASLGLRDGATALLDEARRADPGLPTLEAFLSRAERERGGGDLLAGRYRVLRLLGAGAVGRVYLARDRVTDEEVAVKVVPPPLEPRAREAWRRFLREARAVSSLSHPHVVAAREVIEADGLLVMEYQPGGTLEVRAESGRPGLGMGPCAEARRILVEVIEGLAAAQARGILHRDVKPANIFFAATGAARLGDFGAAHLQDLGATRTSGFVGTLAYMSPEQITAAPLTFACDLYALGVTAFQILTGRLPFEGPDFVGQHLGEAAPAPSRRAGDRARGEAAAVWRAWDAVVLRLLEKDPAARGRSLDELRRALAGLPVLDEALPAPTQPGELDADIGDTTGSPGTPGSAPRSGRYRIEADLPGTALSTLHHAVDERLDRPVVLERFDAEAFRGEVGAARLARLRALARFGGPRLQRVLHLDEEERLAVYEAVPGVPAAAPLADPAAGAVKREIRRALLPVHRAGLAHGAVESAVRLAPWGATVILEGTTARVDVAKASVDGDLAAIAGLSR